MTVLNIKSIWKWEIYIIFQMLIGKSVTLFNEINKCNRDFLNWISWITGKISSIIRWPWSNHAHVCVWVCLVSICNWFYNLIHGWQKQILVFLLSGNLEFGLEKSWKSHGTFFSNFCGNPVTDDKSILVQVMAWCHQATSHYLSQCWPRSLLAYDVTRPQWVKYQCFGLKFINLWRETLIFENIIDVFNWNIYYLCVVCA